MNKEKLEIIHSWVSANVEEPCEISPASNDASLGLIGDYHLIVVLKYLCMRLQN